MFIGAVHAYEDTQIPAPELSVATIVLFALDNSPEVGIAVQKAEQSDAQIRETQSGLYPQATLRADLAREFNDPSSGGDLEAGQSAITGTAVFGVGVTQLLFDGFKTQERIKQNKKKYQSRLLKADKARQDVVIETIAQYLNVYRTQRSFTLMRQFVERLESIYNKIEISYEAGATSKSKLNYAKSRLAFARSDAQKKGAELKDSLSALEFLTGKLPPFLAVKPDELDPSVLDLDFYLEMAAQHNYDVEISDADIQAAEHEYRSEKGNYFPTLNFRVDYEQRNDDGGQIGMEKDVSGTLAVNYNLFDGGKRSHVSDRLIARRTELEIKRSKVLKELQKKIKQSYNQILSIQSNLLLTQEEIDSNSEVRRLNYEKFELGEIDIIELIEGEERLITAVRKKNVEEADLYSNTFKLLQQVGALQGQSFCGSC